MPPTPVRGIADNPPENIRSTDPIIHVVQPIRVIQPVQTIVVRTPASIRDEPVAQSKKPEISNAAMPESKKDFDIEGDSKKDFEKSPEKADELEFDMDSDAGRWRTDEQVRELVIYRYEWKQWPEDVEDKANHPTGLESYYELRYFSDGTNRKGERYADLYKKHRAKRDLWIDEYTASQALMDTPAVKSNVVPLRRTGTEN